MRSENNLNSESDEVSPEELADQSTPAGSNAPAFASALYPSSWRFRPVLGKHPLVKGWVKAPLTAEKAISAYQDGHVNEGGKLKHFNGFAVFTGELSGGLLALDIDGPTADELYKELAKEEYEEFGAEKTMAVTSGKPSRRQLFYQVPPWMISWLTKFNIQQLDSQPDGSPRSGENREELALRFNQCYSLLPGSTHPETKEYKLTNENGNISVSQAPNWIIDILNANKKASKSFLTPEILEFLEEGNTHSGLPDTQLLGWFKQPETQTRVTDKLFEVFYNHHIFGEWNTANEQRTSNFCPFHGGDSGDSFHVDTRPGHGHGWDCKVCNQGGGPLQFLNAIKHQNIYEPTPTGAELQDLVSQVATDLGFKYPDDLLPVKRITVVSPLGGTISSEEEVDTVYKLALEIRESTRNSENSTRRIHKLLSSHGHHFKSGRDALVSLSNWERQESSIYQQQGSINFNPDKIADEYLIPDLIKIPTMIMMHGGSGVGKTRVALGLAKILGENRSIKVRGADINPLKTGNVIYICDDMNESGFITYCAELGIKGMENNWFKAMYDWQSDEIYALKKHIIEIEPVLIIIDSLSSVNKKTGINENDPAIADFLRELSYKNGRDWPAAAILVIHHDKKDGTDFRGSSAIRAAFDEIFHLKKLTEEEVGMHGEDCVMLTITKSRSQRDFAQLLVRTDINGRVNFEDLDRIDQEFISGASSKLGVKELVLAILRKGGVTASEALNKIVAIYAGRGIKTSADDLEYETIHRYIEKWCNAGLLTVDDEKAFYDGIIEPTYKAVKGKKNDSNNAISINTILDTLGLANEWLDLDTLSNTIFNSIEVKFILKLRRYLDQLINNGEVKKHKTPNQYFYALIDFKGDTPDDISNKTNARKEKVLNALTVSENWVCIREIYAILEDRISEKSEIEAISKVLNNLQEEKLVKMKKFRILHCPKPIMYFALTDKENLLPPAGTEPEVEEAPLAEASHNNESVLSAAEQVIEASTFKPKTFWVPEPPEGNSQLEWLSHWPEFFED